MAAARKETKYDMFGSKNKEPPQCTLARSVLGVGRDTAPDEIKKIYRQMAMSCHPDRHPGDKAAEERFKLLSEAYRLLSDDRARGSAEEAFHKAVSQPFYVGNKLFCLGSLYGVRIYEPLSDLRLTGRKACTPRSGYSTWYCRARLMKPHQR